MKNLSAAAALFVFLLVFSAFVFLPKSGAQGIISNNVSNNVLSDLLSLPAPPPPNPDFTVTGYAERPPEFFSQDNPPPDNAPIEDLLAYWERQNTLDGVSRSGIEPSARVLELILGEIDKSPELVHNYLNILAKKPETADAVKRLYDRSLSGDAEQQYQSETLKRWLTLNTDYFSDELVETSQQVKDENEYVTNQDELLALARVNWEKARPMLERMVNDPTQPVSQTLANWAFYRRALREGNSIEADRYRDALKKTVEDKNALPGNRDLALDAIVDGGDFSGRDDWYFSLLEDETLYDLRVNGRTYTGLTTIISRSPPGKYLDKMIQLAGSGNQTVRNAAVRNLMTVISGNEAKIVRALLPWLENPNWAKQLNSERIMVVSALAEVEMPESVPGLIAILDEKAPEKDSPIPDYSADKMSNMMVSNTIDAHLSDTEEEYPYRGVAIIALAKQKSLQAVPALRRILPEVEEWQRELVVRAILESGGFSIGEQVDALESVAESVKIEAEQYKNMAANYRSEYADDGELSETTEDFTVGTMNTNRYYGNMTMDNRPLRTKPFSAADIKPILGKQVANISEPSNELVTAIVSRIRQIERANPSLADAMRKVIENWDGEAVYALMLGDLGSGRAGADVIVKLLSLRKELREKQSSDIFNARNTANPIALGITACLLENENEYAQILSGGSAETKIALLGCARLLRAKLSLQAVAVDLKSPNKMLAKAAELYLESEDSPEARGIIYALYPEKAKILGATMFFAPADLKLGNIQFLSTLFASVGDRPAVEPYIFYAAVADNKAFEKMEKGLQKEIIENTELLGVYAYNENFVRIYDGKAVFSWSENEARYRERTLNQQEFDYLKYYLASNNVNELPPFVSNCIDGCQTRELLMLGIGGGRRVYLRSDVVPKFFDGLDTIFEDFEKPPAKLRYYLEGEVAGLEILYSDAKYAAQTVWKNGAELRLLIEDAERRAQIEEELRRADEDAYERAGDEPDYGKLEEESRKRRFQRAFDHLSWRNLKGEALGDFVGQPPAFEAIPRKDDLPVSADSEAWKRRAGDVEIRNGGDGIYRIRGGQAVKLRDGNYLSPVLSADARFLIAQKYDFENEDEYLVRIDAANGRETKINLKGDPENVGPVVFIPSTGKFLIVAGSSYNYHFEPVGGTYYLLDAMSGAVQPVKGEIRPLVQQTFRPLQTNGKPDEFWAAIPDQRKEITQVGVYNARTLSFTPKLRIPRIVFDSMNLWVDEPGNKIYFVYQGQLLSLPLK